MSDGGSQQPFLVRHEAGGGPVIVLPLVPAFLQHLVKCAMTRRGREEPPYRLIQRRLRGVGRGAMTGDVNGQRVGDVLTRLTIHPDPYIHLNVHGFTAATPGTAPPAPVRRRLRRWRSARPACRLSAPRPPGRMSRRWARGSP